MTKYEPMINCGYFNGQNPSCYDGIPFDTEEECEAWIEENTDNFTYNEISGGIYPQAIEVDDTKEFDDETPTSELLAYVLDECDKETILENAEGFLGEKEMRLFLLACLGEDIY